MKKWIIFLTSFSAFVLFSFFSYLYLYRTDFASTHLTRLFGTETRVQDIVWSKKGIALLSVKMKSAHDSEFLFSCRWITFKLAPLEQLALLLGHRPVQIDKITFIKPTFALETAWSGLLKNAENNRKPYAGRRFFVRKVFLEDVGVEIKGHKVRQPKALSHIEINLSQQPEAMSLDELVYRMAKEAIVQVIRPIDMPELENALRA